MKQVEELRVTVRIMESFRKRNAEEWSVMGMTGPVREYDGRTVLREIFREREEK